MSAEITASHRAAKSRYSVFSLLLGALIAALAFAFVPSISAQEQKEVEAKEGEEELKYKNFQTKRRRAPSPECAQRLIKVQDFFEEELWEDGILAAKQAMRRACKKGFEHSEVNIYIGGALLNQDKYEEAIQQYKLVIDEPEAAPDKKVRIRYTMAQLLFGQERFAEAAEQMEIWMTEVEEPDRGGKYLLARIYYSLNKKDDALELMEEVIDESRERGSVPRESWLNFIWGLYNEKAEFRKAISINHTLLNFYPSVKNWKRLAQLFSGLEDEHKELLAFEVTYMQDGLDKEKQLLFLAKKYMAFDTPFRAAYLLEKGMELGEIEKTADNLQLLGSAWQRSQEFARAAVALEQAAELSEDGNIWARLSGLYVTLNENAKALNAAKNALAKGSLKREDRIWISKGNAEASLHCYEDAEKSFERAATFPKSAETAAKWRDYVVAEGTRRANLIKLGARLEVCPKTG